MWDVIVSNELDFKAVSVREESGVMIRTARIRVEVGEEESPSVSERFRYELVALGLTPAVECKMVQPRTQSIVVVFTECRRFLQNDIGRILPPTSSVLPCLKWLVSERFKEPTQALS